MQIYCFEPQRFDSFHQTVKAGGRITALAVLLEVCAFATYNTWGVFIRVAFYLVLAFVCLFVFFFLKLVFISFLGANVFLFIFQMCFFFFSKWLRFISFSVFKRWNIC